MQLNVTQKAINWLDSEIDVLLNTESEAASIAEVSPQKLVFLDLEPTLQKLHCLLASHRHVARNLLITPNPERPNRVPSCYIQSQNQSIKSRIHKSRQKREREREGIENRWYLLRRQGFGHWVAPTPWRLWWDDHRSHRRRCWGRASGPWSPSLGCSVSSPKPSKSKTQNNQKLNHYIKKKKKQQNR